jgi:peptide methionine sulfoxide reductase msrA/msrB
MRAVVICLVLLMMLGCSGAVDQTVSIEEITEEGLRTAVFAGGCFWCTEADFEELQGVVEAVSGYAGGLKENAEYKEVSRGRTEHVEAVRVSYDAEEVNYEELVTYHFMHIDPTDDGGQFVDRGFQYTTAIFYGSSQEKIIAERLREELEGKLGKPIVTRIVPLEEFFEAEEYHQDYYKKNPVRYNLYRKGSGRDQTTEKLWG